MSWRYVTPWQGCTLSSCSSSWSCTAGGKQLCNPLSLTAQHREVLRLQRLSLFCEQSKEYPRMFKTRYSVWLLSCEQTGKQLVTFSLDTNYLTPSHRSTRNRKWSFQQLLHDLTLQDVLLWGEGFFCVVVGGFCCLLLKHVQLLLNLWIRSES